MRLSRLLLLALLLGACPVAQAQAPPELPVQEQLDIAKVQLDSARTDYQRCDLEKATLWVRARQLSMAYQEQQKEVEALKKAVPPAQPTEILPPEEKQP